MGRLPKLYPGWSRVTLDCPECEGEIDAKFFPGHPGSTYGPPERCFPPDPPELDCEPECPHCGLNLEEHYDDLLLEAEEAMSDY